MDSSSCCKLSNQISALLYEWLHSLSQYFMWFLFYFFKILLLMFVAVGMTDWLVAWLSFLFFLKYLLIIILCHLDEQQFLFCVCNCKIDKIRQWQFCVFFCFVCYIHLFSLLFLKWNWKQFIIFIFFIIFLSSIFVKNLIFQDVLRFCHYNVWEKLNIQLNFFSFFDWVS